MSSILELRKPLKSYIEALDKVHVHAEGGKVNFSDSFFSSLSLPTLDPEDARSLAAELEAAVRPIIARFRAKKLRDFGVGAPNGPAGAVAGVLGRLGFG